MSKTIDLIGQRFGRLTVVSRAENKCGRTNWNCKCDCGNERDILAINLTRGFTKSCGCLHNEQLRERKLIDLSGQNLVDFLFSNEQKITVEKLIGNAVAIAGTSRK